MHTRNVIKVMLAVFAGAFIGAMVALQFTANFWWIGLLAGGLAGYLAYDPAEVIRNIPTAWRTARRETWKYSLGGLIMYFKFMIKEWRSFLRGVQLMLVICMWLYGLGYIMSDFDVSATSQFMSLKAMLISIACIILLFSQLFGSLFATADESATKLFKAMIKYSNPFRVFFYSLPRGIFFGTILLVKFAVKFTVTLFKLIHSDLRLLCGIDAAIGAAIGYFTINPLLGATIGAVWGALNYWLISVKLLKLVPARQRS